jgi:predicted nuclease of predicted toxin-antitoxin system
MRVYLDDNTASPLLARLLRSAGHDVQAPADVGLSGEDDSVHLTQAIRDQRACLTRDHHDFENLHRLLREARGHHAGILVVRQDNDPTRDLTDKGIVAALRKLEAAGVPVADEYLVLNHWR